jgi:hypothetical protein
MVVNALDEPVALSRALEACRTLAVTAVDWHKRGAIGRVPVKKFRSYFNQARSLLCGGGQLVP